jgi:uncharacterized integral membrane protein
MLFGNQIPIEFARHSYRSKFYWTLLVLVLIISLLPIFLRLINQRNTELNRLFIFGTPLIGIFTFIGLLYFMCIAGFGAWINYEITYENRNNTEININRQLWDNGALGYGGERMVELKPILGIWNLVKEIDTTNLKSTEWKRVERNGDLKFP